MISQNPKPDTYNFVGNDMVGGNKLKSGKVRFKVVNVEVFKIINI